MSVLGEDRFRIEARTLDMMLQMELEVYRYRPKQRQTTSARRTISINELREAAWSDDALVRLVRSRIRSAMTELVGEWELRPFRIGRGPRRLQEVRSA